jgi:hypothetical protein
MIDGIWPAWRGTKPLCAGCGHTVPAFNRSTALQSIEELTSRMTQLSASIADADRVALQVPWIWTTKRLSRTLEVLNTYFDDSSALASSYHPEYHHQPEKPVNAGPYGSFAQLKWNISAMSDLSWDWPARVGDPSPAELTWVALHSILHDLEDLELITTGDPADQHGELAAARS